MYYIQTNRREQEMIALGCDHGGYDLKQAHFGVILKKNDIMNSRELKVCGQHLVIYFTVHLKQQKRTRNHIYIL